MSERTDLHGTTTGAGTDLEPPKHEPARATFVVAFDDEVGAERYLVALTSLLGATSYETTVTSSRGVRRTDLYVHEVVERLDRGLVASLDFDLDIGGHSVTIAVEREDEHPRHVRMSLPLSLDTPFDHVWLQCDVETPSSLPILGLPLADGRFAFEALHAFVALAGHQGRFESATVRIGDESPARAWRAERPEGDGLPLVPIVDDVLWAVASGAEAEDESALPAWFLGPPPREERTPADAAWWTRFGELLNAPEASMPELREHLDRIFRIPFEWTLSELSRAPQVPDVVAPERGVVGRLVPTSDRLILAFDLEATSERELGAVLLHLCAHCELGHVRPGDAWGHWDTRETATGTTPRRYWDQTARGLVQQVAPRPDERRVTSLDECTPTEKAWLVLHDQIGRLVGEARTLHPRAERYQDAEYQRQAAQRLVSQLEEYGGAMLCDGVGLGKTYVATTVMVHYVNDWRDARASGSDGPDDDPFRITVLAPNSVVSTWQREAIPPLTGYGVPPATVRVLSHTKFSTLGPNSEILSETPKRSSDLEHLLLSDLVIVDEAHNFRSGTARRTQVLRDLLRLQPRLDVRRKVLLLTATPVNNGLEDLRQQAALLFSKPIRLNSNSTPDGYRRRVPRDVAERLRRARLQTTGDVAATLVHGREDARLSTAIEFRDDLNFGVNVARVGDYLKEQAKRLEEKQDAVRATMRSGDERERIEVRVASDLLDRIVVQRSRALCKQIEQERGSDVKLLFRSDADAPETLVYQDVYDDTQDVLARFLPLFESSGDPIAGDRRNLSVKVHMWSDVRDGTRDAEETTSLVGLQRILVLKRLESSPVAFLVTVLRLLALHAHRLRQLVDLCRETGDEGKAAELAAHLERCWTQTREQDRHRLDLLITGGAPRTDVDHLSRWSAAHADARPAADTDDPLPTDLGLFDEQSVEAATRREELERLWGLEDDVTRDFATLLGVAPALADIVFGRFASDAWPRRFIAGGDDVDWPTSATWGLRIVTDMKLKRLVARLLRARSEGQKAIVFSQFTDTLAYFESVLRATRSFGRMAWRLALRELSDDAGIEITESDVRSLTERTAVITGGTEARDEAIDAFAPYYRLGPTPPSSGDEDLFGGSEDEWTRGWRRSIERPVDVLFATDVLAEGVNLQDAAVLVNYDVHWNPVRMIQRSGRVDRRLNPAIEEATAFPHVERLAEELGRPAPRYWWADHPDATPVTVNLLLPDELEEALQLRERIANKTLAIDFTLGLEHGTGAEADWMAEYRYQGISALNAWRSDRAIERVARSRERLRRMLERIGADQAWLKELTGWLRESTADEGGDVIAWARFGRANGGEIADYTRHLRPRVEDGVPHWLWTTAKPQELALNFWLILDGRTPPPGNVRHDLGWDDTASRPYSADALLDASMRIVDDRIDIEDLGRGVGRQIQQGLPAISAGFFGSDADRSPRALTIEGVRILQFAGTLAGEIE